VKTARNHLLPIATGMVWIVAYSAYTADWVIGVMPFAFERAVRRIPVCLFGACCCWGLKLLLDRTASQPTSKRLAIAIGLCVLASLAYALVNTIVFYILDPIWGMIMPVDALQAALDVLFVFFAWIALYFAIDADTQARDARIRLADAQTEAQRARNQALAQQMSPHFLFNALNTVSGLIIDGEPQRAERVTVALAGLLRRSLETDMREHVWLGEEIDSVHRYLEIEKSRFEGRLFVSERIPESLRSLAVPPMILQPLIENAVKHGVARSAKPVRLTLAAEERDGTLRITVTDDAKPDRRARPAQGTGTGHANVRQRLALMYGDRASLTCDALPRGGYSAELIIPAERDAAA
jgi:LytS/YehU family sensor histidine kinase